MVLVLQSVAEICRCRYVALFYYVLYYVVKRGKHAILAVFCLMCAIVLYYCKCCKMSQYT